MLDSSTKTTTTNPVGSSRTEGTQAFRAMADNGSARAKETFEKMSAATADATTLMKDSYSTAVKGAQDYNTKFIEFARANTEATFEFAKNCRIEIAFRVFRIVDQSYAQATRNADRTDQRTHSASPENHARDRGALQDGRQ